MTLLQRLQAEGIQRKGSPERGFRYVTALGKPVTAAERARIEALVLPPAWTDVRIHPSPRAHLQAIGKDKAGRWQYRYHRSFRERQEARKYDRLVHFAEALPKMRKTVQAHLRRPGLGREKVMAGILTILANCFIRPGSQAYADEHGSYGLATLRPKHVKVTGDTVHFDFPGKSGQQQAQSLRDRRVANLVRKLLQVPGRDLFKFIDEEGKVVDVRRRHINAYIKELMGERFSAKDFRTWAGTLVAASALARSAEELSAQKAGQEAEAVARSIGAPPADREAMKKRAAREARERKRMVTAAVKEAAALLGNTPTVCRASYIYPSVLSAFDRGVVVQKYFLNVDELAQHRTFNLHPSEKALLALLKTAPRGAIVASARARGRTTAAQQKARNARDASRTRSAAGSMKRKTQRAQHRRTGRGATRRSI